MKSLAWRIALAVLAALSVQGVSAQRVFRDCAKCPEMVVIPSGSYLMGGDPFSKFTRETELPQHRVQIQSFAIGKYEVTQKQWYAVMGNNPSSQKGRMLPVDQVSGEDIQEFISKLNQKTRQRYRLPSEAEWEYAARAGTNTYWSFGNDESKLCNYAWDRQCSGGRARMVGQKKPNAVGLFDIHGHVWEWTQDCWHESYAGAPTDGSAWTSGCAENQRVVRGGSWFYFAYGLGSATRDGLEDDRMFSFGFRLARDL